MQSFNNIFAQCGDVRRCGSAALDLAYVAAGRYDGYWERGVKAWDVAAGELLVRESGGLATDFKGGNDPLNTGEIVAGNPRVFGGRIDIGAYENQSVYVKINDSPVYSKIKLYPNPGTDKIYIEIPKMN